jgi:acetate kinase
VKILVLNCGGSSMKYQLLDMDNERVIVKGMIDRLGSDKAILKHETAGVRKIEEPTGIRDFSEGIGFLVNRLLSDGVIKNIAEIDAFAHKLAHGGERFTGSVLIDDEVLDGMRECSILAPVHNPPSIRGIEISREIVPDIPQIGVFETTFHRSLPAYVWMYGIPYEWYEKHGVRKYGFHGASHGWAARRVEKITGTPASELKIVSCHLGSGTSVCGIKYGRSIDISSGFTPQSGTIMSTRPGDFDPWVFPFLMQREGLTADELNQALVKRGGLLGISGVSGDMRDIEEAANEGNERAKLTIDVFCYQVKKYIGAFTAAMNGLDVLVFTGGIGENGSEIRSQITCDMDYFGIKIDPDKNSVRGRECIISSDDSKVKVVVILTNEELMVATQAKELLESVGASA